MTIYFKRLVGICLLFLTLLSCEKNELHTANEKVRDLGLGLYGQNVKWARLYLLFLLNIMSLKTS